MSEDKDLQQLNSSPSLWRGALAQAFMLGCLVSAMASGRFSIRLIVDGAVSFAFVPVFEIVALAIVCHGRRRSTPVFTEVVDRFFAGNKPWFVWITILAAAFAVVPPREVVWLLKPALFGSAVLLVWNLAIDMRLFRGVLHRSTRRAWWDVAFHRLMAWSAVLTYFFGITAWHRYLLPIGTGLGL